jgi:cell wall-associated NlpC family hydrolase
LPLAAIRATALLAMVSPVGLAAQRLSFGASRWLTAPAVSEYRLSISRYDAGPLALTPFAQLTAQGPRSDGALLAGVGVDLTLRLGARALPYLVVGGSGGVLDLRRDLGFGSWAGWSVGIGLELVRTSLAALALEARYQELSRRQTRGVSLGARLGASLGRRREPAPAGPDPRGAATVAAPDQPSPGPPAAAGRLDRVVAAAVDAMGAPYRWGGSSENGFDCSGLILHSYAQIGIALPRRAREQALAGEEVGRDLNALAAGDILTFAARPGGEVTHVGLYLGAGRFIHSASDGVQESALDPVDPTGSWWYQRWVGARRVLGAR